jgi:hypothetical protein
VVLLAMQDDNDSREEDEGLVDAVVDGEEVPTHQWGIGCCCVRKAPNIECCSVFVHIFLQRLWGDSPVYSPTYFKRFFRLLIGHFDEIITRIVAQDNYFCQKKDISGKLGLLSLQKIYLAVCQLTSDISSIQKDDK